MSQNTHLTSPIMMLFCGISLVVLAGCNKEVAKAPEPIRPVKILTMVKGADTRPITYSGSIRPRAEQTLSFRVAGKIIERRVNVGDRVKPGQILARLDTTDLALSARTSDANVEAAKARRDVAADAFERNKALFDKGFIAKSVLDQRSLELDQAKSALDSAQFRRDQAANQQRYGALASDVVGVVTDVRADVGQVTNAGTPVIVIAPDAEREVAVAIPEQDIRFFQPGATVTTRYWAEPSLVQTGTIREVSASADAVSRTFAVRIAIPEDARVRLGQTASITIAVPVGDAPFVVPLSAIDERSTSTVVWVADPATSTVSPRPIRLDGLAADGVRVASGLSAGDIVVVAGTQFMQDGKKVRLASEAPRTAGLN